MSTLLDAPATGRRQRASQASDPAPRPTGAALLDPTTPRADHGALLRLERALHVLLTPLDSTDLPAWRREVHAALLEVFAAEGLSLYFPIRMEGDAASESALDDWYAPHLPPADALALLADAHALDAATEADAARAAERAFQARGVAAACTTRSARGRDDAGVRAAALPDATFVRVPFGGAADARLWIVGGAQSPDERIALVRTLTPALRAGLSTWAQLGARRAALARLLDAGGAPVLAFDSRGGVLHESTTGARLLAEESAADAARVRDAARHLALSLVHARSASPDGGAPTVRTARHRYELIAMRSATLFGREPIVVVSLRKQTPAALDDAALRARFALTKREIQVARLLAEGLSNVEVAERMGVSFFTARNHVERLLRKLGVSNRARVGALLRDESGE